MLAVGEVNKPVDSWELSQARERDVNSSRSEVEMRCEQCGGVCGFDALWETGTLCLCKGNNISFCPKGCVMICDERLVK